jgi:uncharacterized protein (DUF4415 family)
MKKKIDHLRPLTAADEARIQRGIAEDPENPEWTEEDFKNARPFAEVFPELAESIRRARGRPPVDTPRQQISIRLDPDVIAKFKATGKGWQSRINDVLKKAKV